MDNDKCENMINKFIECNEVILKNEKYLEKLKNPNNNNNEVPICYLIDNKFFIKLKDDLNYEVYKKDKKDDFEETLKKQIQSNSEFLSYNIKKFDQINNIASLLNVLLNNNEIILINKELWEIICIEGKENEEGYAFIFDNSNITLFLSENIPINFTDINSGIITLNSFYDSNKEIKNIIKENEDKLLKLFNSMKEYFLFEKTFSDNTNNTNKEQNSKS